MGNSDVDNFIKEEFETAVAGATWVVESLAGANRLEAAKNSIRSITANSFLVDIYTEATNLRNVLGDSDGLAAEISANICRDTLVVATSLLKKPARLIVDALRSQPLEVAIEKARETIEHLEEFIQAATEELNRNDNSN